MKKANYQEFTHVPPIARAVWKDGKVINDDHPFKWSGDKAPPKIGDEVKVYRDVFLSVHEDIEFMARVRSVSRHLAHIFDRDMGFLNEF